MKKRSKALMIGLPVLGLAASLALLRPPQPGNVYRTSSDLTGLPEPTALLVKLGECLSLSQSPIDIGRGTAETGSSSRLFILATGRSVRAEADDQGPYLIDRASGLRARPGEAIDGEIIAYAPRSIGEDWLENSLSVRWPIARRCGHSLAVVYSIKKVRSSTQ
jgi:hypothetical protein